MEWDEKYMEEIKKVDKELNPLIKIIALKRKEGKEITKEEEVYNKLRKRRKTLLDEYTKENDLKILERCIKKEDLVDGAWYETDKEGEEVARWVDKAQWIEKDNHFLAPGQQQFGMDGYLDYFGDVINTGMAGFPPMKRVDE